MKTRLLIAVALTCLSMPAQGPEPPPNQPRYTSGGELIRPDNYREWIYLSSGLGMSYRESTAGTASTPHFDNVFVTPQAYKAFLGSGRWPDKTMFALEIRSSGSKASINKGGHFQEEMVALEVEVKDANKWAYFAFGPEMKPVKPLLAAAGCQACHSTNAAVENTFVQFYPTLLPVAKAKGTLKATQD